MDRNKFHYMSGAALFAGIMAVLSQFAFPVGAVPVTLQTFVCAFAGGVLGWKWGAVSISVWLLLGALGVPILTMGKAGVGIDSGVGNFYPVLGTSWFNDVATNSRFDYVGNSNLDAKYRIKEIEKFRNEIARRECFHYKSVDL